MTYSWEAWCNGMGSKWERLGVPQSANVPHPKSSHPTSSRSQNWTNESLKYLMQILTSLPLQLCLSVLTTFPFAKKSVQIHSTPFFRVTSSQGRVSKDRHMDVNPIFALDSSVAFFINFQKIDEK